MKMVILAELPPKMKQNNAVGTKFCLTVKVKLRFEKCIAIFRWALANNFRIFVMLMRMCQNRKQRFQHNK